MIKYVHDPILNNKTKEKLYKLHTRAFPEARKFNNTVDTHCAFCGIVEDEMHCFVQCNRLFPLWAWVKQVLSHGCPWLALFTEIVILFGYPLVTIVLG
jgi:hypothetical protein